MLICETSPHWHFVQRSGACFSKGLFRILLVTLRYQTTMIQSPKAKLAGLLHSYLCSSILDMGMVFHSWKIISAFKWRKGKKKPFNLDLPRQLLPAVLLPETASIEPEGHTNGDNPLLRLSNAPNKNFPVLNSIWKTGSAWRFEWSVTTKSSLIAALQAHALLGASL